MATRVLVCGSRDWTDKDTIKRVLATWPWHGPVTVVHGGCRGADTIAGNVAFNLGYRVEQYNADWKQYGRAAGPIRNALMLEQDIDLVIGFHADPNNSKGTKDMLDKAGAAGIATVIYNGDDKESEQD